VKPESALFLEKSRSFLAKAQSMLVGVWPDEAGRAAYLAGLHAARAFIFETTGEVTKSHKRARSEFARLTKDDPRFDRELRAFLGRTFNLKRLADYETGPGSEVSPERATQAIDTAHRFVAAVATLLEPEPDRSR
jgi:uncharacterized protein (UPF0332 family)